MHEFPKVGFSIILDPQYGASFTWLTTQITEVIELKEEYLKLKLTMQTKYSFLKKRPFEDP